MRKLRIAHLRLAYRIAKLGCQFTTWVPWSCLLCRCDLLFIVTCFSCCFNLYIQGQRC